jgi:hypothetical protein
MNEAHDIMGIYLNITLENYEIDEENFDNDMDWLLEHLANSEQNESLENCNITN